MKILHVIAQRPDSTGSGIYLQQIVARAAHAGHVNFLVCGVGKDDMVDLEGIDTGHIMPVRFETNDNPGHIVGMSDVMPYPSRTFRSLDADALERYQQNIRDTLISAVNKFKPDLVHAHHLWLTTSIIGEEIPDIPTAVSCHGSELRQFSQCPHLQQFVQEGCRQIDRICALSSLQKNDINNIYQIASEKIAVCGAGLDGSVFHPASMQPQRTHTQLQILYAGKLSRAKGVVWLLQALIGLQGHPFHLHIAGSGYGTEYDQCLDIANQLQNRITFHGALPQKQLAKIMQQCHVLVLPSMFEGLPLVILESLACGCRVIATDLPGVKEIAGNVNPDHLTLISTPAVIDTDSTIIDDENRFVSDLTDALRSYLDNINHLPPEPPELTYFTWQSVYNRIEAVWENMVKTEKQ